MNENHGDPLTPGALSRWLLWGESRSLASNTALISIPWMKFSESAQTLAAAAGGSLLVLIVSGLAIHLLYLLLNDKEEDVRQLEVINLSSFRTESIRLGSPPDHIGFIPNDGNPRIYISQEHPVGRMTFIDETSDEIKTVTGFELNSLID